MWFGAPGFEVLDVLEGGDELVIDVQTTASVVGCSGCGTRDRPKDRRWVLTLDMELGIVAERRGRLDDARGLYRQALTGFPADADVDRARSLMNLAATLRALGEHADAR